MLHDMELALRQNQNLHDARNDAPRRARESLCASAPKLHGLVRAELTVHKDLLPSLRCGLFAQPKTYRCYVKFATQSADGLPDLSALGPLQMSVKVLGVQGKKLLEDEKYTQDFLAQSVPTRATADVRSDALLQGEILRGTPLLYFFSRREPRVLNFLMQLLWNQAYASPLECHYYSGRPCLLGAGQAMQYSFQPRAPAGAAARIPGYPFRTPADYLRQNMRRALSEGPVEFDLMAQVQTDPHRMPIEDATVRWPVHMSPPVPLATLHIPQQSFDSTRQREFATQLAFTPWHALPEHRPLGSQNRAQKRSYLEISRLLQSQNAYTYREPTGDEQFEGTPPKLAGKSRRIPQSLSGAVRDH